MLAALRRQPAPLPRAVRPAVGTAAAPDRTPLRGVPSSRSARSACSSNGTGSSPGSRSGEWSGRRSPASSASTARTPTTAGSSTTSTPRPCSRSGSPAWWACCWLLFRPLVARPTRSAGEWERAEALVRRYGWDTLASFALRDDKSFFFSSDGEAMIAYTYMGGLRAGVGRPDRGSRLAPDRRGRVRRDVRRTRVEPLVPRGARGRRARLRRPRVPPLLPGRRGDHPLRHLRARGAGDEGRARVGAPGRQAVPLRADPGVEGLADAGAAAQRDQCAVAREEARARLHDDARARTSRAPIPSSCSAWPSTSTTGPAASCASCPPTAPTSATRWT